MSNKEITPKTEVNVYNNTSHEVGFELANGRKIYLNRVNQFKKVFVDDMDYLLNIAPAMLTEGMLYIRDQKVREHLDIDSLYKDGTIIAISQIEKMLSKEDKELKKSLEKASKSARKELAKKASSKKDKLTGGQVKIIEDITQTKLGEI